MNSYVSTINNSIYHKCIDNQHFKYYKNLILLTSIKRMYNRKICTLVQSKSLEI